MAKREELKLEITAKDDASKVIDEVASKVEGLSGKATVEIDATDEASEVIDGVSEDVQALDEETAEPTLSAEDEATEVVEDVSGAVEDLDGASAEPTLSADDEASGPIADVAEALDGIGDASATITVDDTEASGIGDIAAELDSIDGETFSATVEVDDSDASGVGDIAADLESIDGETFDATFEVDDSDASGASEVASDLESIDGETFSGTLGVEGAEAASEATGEVVGNLASMIGTTGLAALAGLGLGAIGQGAADQVEDIAALSDAVGGTLDQTSRVKEAWERAGGNVTSLERNVIHANDRIRESPELAAKLGDAITANQSPLDTFIAAVEFLNSGQLTANERLELATQIFGTKGVLILDDLQTRVGDLSDGMAAVSDNEIITQQDVDNARLFNDSMDSVQDALGAMAREALPSIASILEGIVPLAEGVGAALDLALGDVPTGEYADLNVELAKLFGSRTGTTFVDDLVEGWRQLKADLADNGVIDTTGDLLSMFADQAGVTEEQVLALAGAEDEATASTDEVAASTAEAADTAEAYRAAIDEQTDSLEATRDALQEATDVLDEQIDAQRGAADAYYAERDAARDAEDAVSKYNEASAEGFENDNDRQAALDDVVGAYDKLAQAAVTSARTEREATGASLTRTESIDIENRSLMTQATNLDGPLRSAVLAHVLRINGIPQQRITTILTDNDPNDLAQVEAELANASRTRKAAVKADADDAALSNTETQLNNLARNRTATIYTTRISSGGGGGHDLATGTPYALGGIHLVGEQGPELVSLPGGADVTNAGQTAEWMRRGGATTNNYYTTQNFPAGVRSRDVRRAERRYDRTQAS